MFSQSAIIENICENVFYVFLLMQNFPFVHTYAYAYNNIQKYITVIVSLISFLGLAVLLIKMLMDWDFYISWYATRTCLICKMYILWVS